MRVHTIAIDGADYFIGKADTVHRLTSQTPALRGLPAVTMRAWFDNVAVVAAGGPEITVIADDVPGRRDETPTAAMHNLASALTGPAGWTTSDIGRSGSTGWSTWVRSDDPQRAGLRIHLGVRSLMDADRTPLFRPTDSAERVALNLALYFTATGGVWHATAGVSGCGTIRRMVADGADDRVSAARRRGQAGYRRTEPRWRWDAKPTGLVAAGDMRISRRLTGAERHGYVHQLDIRSQYLAAAGGVVLPYGSLVASTTAQFDPKVPGYWQIRGDVLPQSVRPWCVDMSTAALDVLTVTTPVMTYLNDHGINPEVISAWVPTSPGMRVLRPWVDRLVKARTAVLPSAHPDVTAAWKRTYAETIGMFAAPGGSIFRPDWRDIIIDLARCNLLRKLDKVHSITGTWPVRIYADSIYLASDDDVLSDDVLYALGVIDADGLPTDTIGKFRHIRTTPADAYMASRTATTEE